MPKQHPVIWITWDEAHIDTLGVFGAGTHRTPNVDALAARSHHFINARTASPVCLPARCAMATGLRPSTSGSMSNNAGAALRPDAAQVFSLMHAHNYRTAMFGKCHFVPVPYAVTSLQRTLDYEPTLAYYRSLGIDELVVEDGKQCSVWFYDDWGKAIALSGLMDDYRAALANRENDRVFPFPGPEDLHPDRWVADQAIDYIRSAPDNAFIWISFAGPHYPQDPPQRCMDAVDVSKLPPRKIRPGEWDDKRKLHAQSFFGPGVTEGSARVEGGAQCRFTPEYWERWQKGYRGNVVLLDECMGDVLAALRQRYGDDALIIFTADHGDMSGHHGIWAKNSAVYEDVLRIPLMVHLPGQTQGVVHDEPAGNLDLLPTTLHAAFGEAFACDGRDVLGSAAPDVILSEQEAQIAVIHDGLKLSVTRRKGVWYQEMYDLVRDPNEFDNVFEAPEYAQAQARLLALLHEDEARYQRIFYDGDVFPYWMAPLQKGVKRRPRAAKGGD